MSQPLRAEWIEIVSGSDTIVIDVGLSLCGLSGLKY